MALGPMPGQALLPVKYTSKPPLSFHLLQHPRPAQPILPGSFWSSPASPPPLPAAHRGVGLKRSPKHTTPCINPSVASCRTWTKPKLLPWAHSGPCQTLQFHPSSLAPAPPHWPHPLGPVAQGKLRCRTWSGAPGTAGSGGHGPASWEPTDDPLETETEPDAESDAAPLQLVHG